MVYSIYCPCLILFRIAITSFGEERANLSAFRTFVRFVLVWFCRFPLPLGVWEGLRFVVVAITGLFSLCSRRLKPFYYNFIIYIFQGFGFEQLYQCAKI